MTGGAPSDHGRLPDGFRVRLDRATRAYEDGRVLIGGSPKTMLSLAPAARDMINDGVLDVAGDASAAVARRVLASGVGHPEPSSDVRIADVTVVIPVKNNRLGLARLLETLGGFRVVVVDDGSDVPLAFDDDAVSQFGCESISTLRQDISTGPAAARNAGLRQAETTWVVFLDSDVVPCPGWLEAVGRHFADPAVALVAPRIAALDGGGGALARYERARSSLDLGSKPAPVRPGSAVSYVPSAAMMARRSAIEECGGFDETMHVGEDVDLCWRLQKAGWHLRYEPGAQVAHDHRVSFRAWFARRLFYGTSAGPLARRHRGMVPPIAMSRWTLAAVVCAASGARTGRWIAFSALAITAARLSRTFAALDRPLQIATVLTAESFLIGSRQLALASSRHYWPLTLVAGIVSRRVRRIVVCTAVAESLFDWFEHREPGGLDPVRYAFYKRADDIAYGSGLWCGAVRSKSTGALLPKVGL